jgi:hypothetical protein
MGVISQVAQGAQWLGSLLDVADAGQRAYFDRHPSIEGEPRVAEAITRSRLALATLDHALAAGSAEDQATARREAVAAYEALRKLYDELGVLDARPSPGGPETDAPLPKPLPLPTGEEVAAVLGVS